MNKKKLIVIFSIPIFLLGLAGPSIAPVKFVYDGDTILLGTGEKVRYLGIDAPEIGREGKKDEFLALESRAFNRRLVGESRVRLEYDREKRDRYGRLLAYVFRENGEMVNALLVAQGFARILVKKPNTKYFSRLLKEQRRAMEANLGIWRKGPENPEKYYLGNKNSYRFHRPGCPLGRRIHPRNLLKFKTSRKAFWNGFSPAKKCKP